jgi:hypothetical protein
MHQAGRALRLGGAAAGLMLLAGCGSAHPTGTATSQNRSHAVAGSHGAAGSQSGTGMKADNGTDLVAGAGQGGPASGSKKQALALARTLLPVLILPPGTVRLRHVPPQLRGVGAGLGARDVVDIHRQFALQPSMRVAARYLREHVPPGMRFQDDGSTGGSGGPSLDLAYVRTLDPAGIYQAEIDLTVVPAIDGGSLVRADAQVIWQPPRTVAEHIDPARFSSLVVTAHENFNRNHAVTKRVTSRAVITRLAGLLNALPADPGLAVPCPLGPASYRLGFAATTHGRPSVVADIGGCFTIGISADGKPQPALADQQDKITTFLQHLMGIRP